MITLVVLCLLTLELEGSLCKPTSLPNMPSAAQKLKAAAKAAQKAAAAQKKLKVAAPEPDDGDSEPLNGLLRAPETLPDETLEAIFQDTQVDQATIVEESPSLALSQDGQPRDSLEAPHPTHPHPI